MECHLSLVLQPLSLLVIAVAVCLGYILVEWTVHKL